MARAAVAPACRRGLRIEVDDNGGETAALRSAGSGDGERGLIRAAFLCAMTETTFMLVNWSDSWLDALQSEHVCGDVLAPSTRPHSSPEKISGRL